MCCSMPSSFGEALLLWLSAVADIGYAGPLMLLALAVLLLRGHLRLALSWGVGIVAALGMTVMLKWILAGDPVLSHFPSGHVVLAVVFYGGLTLILLPNSLRWTSLLLVLGAVAFAEGVSRIALTEHGWLDVAGGFIVGLSGLVLTGNPWSWSVVTARDRMWLTGTLATAMPFASMAHSDIDPWIRGIAGV
jgi:membrane-associated phospholipid phosphatase